MPHVENVFGIPIQVNTREEAAEQAARELVYYAVVRCEDMPRSQIPVEIRHRMVIVACKRCDKSCWLDSKGYIPPMVIVCVLCCPRGGTESALDETLNDMRRFVGLS